MGQETEDGKNWRIVRNRVCIRALLIFLGIILMQVLAYMLCVFGIMIYGLIAKQQVMELFENLAKADVGDGRFVITVSLVSALLSGIWCGILYHKSDWRERPFDYHAALCGKNILSAAATGIGCCLFLQILLSILAMWIPEAFESYNQVMGNLTDSDTVIVVLYVLLIGPITEELIFRGAILDRFYLAFPFLAANLLQAVLFGIYHMNLIQGLYAFCLGMVLGLARFVSGSILIPAFIHIMFNTTSYVTSYFFAGEETAQTGTFILLMLFGAVLLFIGLRHWWYGFQKKVIN
ncbi:MAG TPA: hypothetical protein DDY31_04910 [Lachnospiraceae bacterium]|nr:hypothetical protein [Lachnospiraceae bacterium]